MKRSARLKKRFLPIFLRPAGYLMIAAGALDFLIHYRFSESISYLVARESKGRYAFSVREASISLWRGTVILKGSQLSCLDIRPDRSTRRSKLSWFPQVRDAPV